MDEVKRMVEDIEELKKIRAILKEEIIQLDDEILFQEFGVYQPQYEFTNIDQYKSALRQIKKEQRAMIKNGKAAICSRAWKVDGSEEKGKRLIAENIKQIIRNFNIECDICIDKVRFSNYESSKKRM